MVQSKPSTDRCTLLRRLKLGSDSHKVKAAWHQVTELYIKLTVIVGAKEGHFKQQSTVSPSTVLL